METVTGQCDHIVGFHADEFPQFGGIDSLVRTSAGIAEVTEAFIFCPLCGQHLRVSEKDPLVLPGQIGRPQ
jgi:hypothetical protein